MLFLIWCKINCIFEFTFFFSFFTHNIKTNMAKNKATDEGKNLNLDIDASIEKIDLGTTKIKKIIPINCTYTDLILLSDLIPSQGELKVSKGESIDKLEASFDKHGFIKPFVLWHNSKTDKPTLEMLDGHQRRKLLLRMAVKGIGTENLYIPVIYSKAPTKEQAMQILLHLVEQTGDITQSGLLDFAQKYKMSLDDIAKTMSLKSPALALAQKKAQEQFTAELQQDPEYPIQPQFAEHYGSVTIFYKNEMDELWLINYLNLGKTKDYNSTFVAPARVINVEQFQKIVEDRESKLLNSKPNEDADK